MPSTAAYLQGTTLKVDDTTPGTADVAIGNIKSFSGFDGETAEIDVTNLSSTAKEYRAGLQDFGSFSLDVNPDYSDSGQAVLRAAQASGAVKTFELELPNGVKAAFQGVVKNAQAVNGSVDTVLEGSISIRVTGAVTFTVP